MSLRSPPVMALVRSCHRRDRRHRGFTDVTEQAEKEAGGPAAMVSMGSRTSKRQCGSYRLSIISGSSSCPWSAHLGQPGDNKNGGAFPIGLQHHARFLEQIVSQVETQWAPLARKLTRRKGTVNPETIPTQLAAKINAPAGRICQSGELSFIIVEAPSLKLVSFAECAHGLCCLSRPPGLQWRAAWRVRSMYFVRHRPK